MASLEFEKIVEDFELLEEWEDRYKYIIDMGKQLPIFDESLKSSETKVDGCASQVWIFAEAKSDGNSKTLEFQGDSDAVIVKGLIALLISLYNNVLLKDLSKINAVDELSRLDLDQHLSSQRSNGLFHMVERIKLLARANSESD